MGTIHTSAKIMISGLTLFHRHQIMTAARCGSNGVILQLLPAHLLVRLLIPYHYVRYNLNNEQ